MKKILFLMICIFSCMFLFPYDITDLEGSWIDEEVYQEMINKKEMSVFKKEYGWKYIYSTSMFILLPDEAGWGAFEIIGLSPIPIVELEKKTDTRFGAITKFITEYIYDDTTNIYIPILDDSTKMSCEIVFVDSDVIVIKGALGVFYETGVKWHRISGPAKIKPQSGKINDSRVRIRTKPELNSDTWGFLNKGDKVRIVDRSNEKQKIGDMESYWYKVQTEGYPDGWVYGAYIEVE